MKKHSLEPRKHCINRLQSACGAVRSALPTQLLTAALTMPRQDTEGLRVTRRFVLGHVYEYPRPLRSNLSSILSGPEMSQDSKEENVDLFAPMSHQVIKLVDQ